MPIYPPLLGYQGLPEEEDPYLAELQALEQEQFQPGQFKGSFAEDFAGIENTPFRAPQSFGEGLAYGLTRGIGGAGTRTQTARQKFEQSEAQRRQAFDQERRQASRELRSLTGQERRAKIKADLDAKKDQAKYERDNPLVDDAMVARYPDIPGLARLKGQRVEQSFIDRYQLEAPERKERAERQDAAAARAEATALRAAEASERAARAAIGAAEGRLVDDYKADNAVKAYQNVRANIQTAEVARKQKNGVGDVALIFSYMRALEPDNPNVVREGDFKVARLAAGKLQSLQTLPARFFNGDMLTESGREFFLKQMRESLNARKPAFESANAKFKRRAAGQGVEPSNVITEFRDTPQGLGSERDFSPYIIPDKR